MSKVTGAALDKFQDIAEPFIAAPDYSAYFYLGVLLFVIAFLYGLYRYKTNFHWRRLKLIERDCLRGSPRIALQRIYAIVKQVTIIPEPLNQEIKLLCYGQQKPTLNELGVLLVKLKPVLAKPVKPEVSSRVTRAIND